MECRGYKQREVWKNNQSPRRLGSVYPQAIDCPIGLAERGREFVDKVYAGVREGGTLTLWLWPNSASPITAERQVEYYPLSVEMRVVVAIIWEHWEIRYRLTPSGTWKDRLSLWCTLTYLGWDGGAVSRPEPHLNAGRLRFRHGVVSATVLVERRAIGGTDLIESRGIIVTETHTTPLVTIGSNVTVGADGSPRLRLA